MKNRTDMEKYLLKHPLINQKWLNSHTDEEIRYIYNLFKEEESAETDGIDEPSDNLKDSIKW